MRVHGGNCLAFGAPTNQVNNNLNTWTYFVLSKNENDKHILDSKKSNTLVIV